MAEVGGGNSARSLLELILLASTDGAIAGLGKFGDAWTEIETKTEKVTAGIGKQFDKLGSKGEESGKELKEKFGEAAGEITKQWVEAFGKIAGVVDKTLGEVVEG